MFRTYNKKIIRVISVLTIILVSIPAFAIDGMVLALPGVVFPVLAPRLSSGYGPRNHPIRKMVRHHKGVDLAAPTQSHVRSIAEGLVVFAGELPGYGKVVTIKHDGDYISLYGHLDSYTAIVGQKLPAGSIIGRVGSTGMATGPHLHFEWRKGNKSIDPLEVFPDLASEPVG